MATFQRLKKVGFGGLFAAALCLADSPVMAQQDAAYSQYMFNMLPVNPAYAGSRDVLSLTGLYRTGLVGFEGAPTTQTFSADMPISKERIGVGLTLFNDKVGVQGMTGGNLSFAFKAKVSERATLSLGLQAGAMSYRANYTDVNTGAIDPAFANNISRVIPNFGTGIFFSTDRFYLGVSVPQILRQKLNVYAPDNSPGSRQERHFFGMMGFVFPAGRTVVFKPSFLVKAVPGAPVSVDANLNAWFNNRIAIGASYRISQSSFNSKIGQQKMGDALVGLLELQLTNQFRLGYSYDYPINGLQTYTSGSHEVMLRYEFGFTSKKILTPRYF